MTVEIRLFEFWKEKEIERGSEITVTEVSNKTGMTRAALINLRKGRTERVELETLDRLCWCFDVPPGPVPFLIYHPGD